MYEGFQYVAMQAWKNKSGARELDYPDQGLIQPMEPAGQPWSEEGNDLRDRFPQLWNRFSISPPRFIRIVASPPGEAPPAIRSGWIGCTLPLLPGTDQTQTSGISRGVISGRPAEPGLKYKVDAVDAFAAFEQHDAVAAQWWREKRATAFPNGEVAGLRSSRVRAVAPKRVVSNTDGCDGWDHSICRRLIDWGQKVGTCSSRLHRLPSWSSPMTSRWVVLALVTYRVIQTVGPFRGSDPAGSCLRACWRRAAAPSNPPSPMDSTAVLGTSISAPFSLSPS